MIIRHATLDDLEAIAAVEAACFPAAEACSEESFRRRLEAYPDHFWLLEEEVEGEAEGNGAEGFGKTADEESKGGVAGNLPAAEAKNGPCLRLASFVNGMVTDERDLRDEMYGGASLHDEGGAWQMIFGVATAPTCQHRGYAGTLLRRVIADVREQGRAGLVLTCKDHLLAYYGRFGFVDEGVSGSEHGGVAWHQMRLAF